MPVRPAPYRDITIAKQPAPEPHMLSIVLHNVPRVGRSYEHVPDGFKFHLLHPIINLTMFLVMF